MAAFRETFSDLHELRSLAPSVNIMTLTATATRATRETSMDVLLMNHPHVILESPGKPNIAYSVYYIPKDRCLRDDFQWLGDELLTEKELTTCTIIYCQTIKQCGLIYSTRRAMLGKKIFLDETGDNPRDLIMEMLQSCTPEANKAAILQSFQVENSSLRVLVATIAFGMGVDCEGVYMTIHFGPSKNIEAYIQKNWPGRQGWQTRCGFCCLSRHSSDSCGKRYETVC